MKRAVIYVRVSDPRQAEADKVSLGEQEERCRRYCASKKYSVVGIYKDAGKSGLTKRFKEHRWGVKATSASQDATILNHRLAMITTRKASDGPLMSLRLNGCAKFLTGI